MSPSPLPSRPAGLPKLPASELEGVDESTWLDVIHKMDEVYSQLVHDEIQLEQKNIELEQSEILRREKELEATVFFVTHDVPEAVYLGDRVFIFSPSPGTLVHQLQVAPPDRPARQMQAEPAFLDSVRQVRTLLDNLETTNDAKEAS